jgi:hypothetical protein
MVELKCVKGAVHVQAEGDIAELCADVITMLHAFYTCLYEKSTIEAITFRDVMENELSSIFVIRDKEEEE